MNRISSHIQPSRKPAMLLAAALLALPLLALGSSTRPHTAVSNSHSQGYLGVELHDITEDQIAALHLPGGRGAEITMVDHDGPAGKAGLQPHDVIVQVDGQNIDGADDLRRRIRESAPGRVLNLAIMRLGRLMNLSAKIANREELERNAWQPQPLPPAEDPPQNVLVQRYSVDPATGPARSSHGQSFLGSVLRSGPYTGLSLEAMEPQLAVFFGAPANSGLLVHAVETNSPAASAGLHAGDIVLRVDSIAVASPSDWTKRMRAANGRAVSLTVLRDKREQQVTLQPELKRHSLLEWPKLF